MPKKSVDNCRGFIESNTQERIRRYSDGTIEKEVKVSSSVKRCPGETPDPKPSPKPSPEPTKPIAYNDSYNDTYEGEGRYYAYQDSCCGAPPPVPEPLPPTCLEDTIVEFFV